MANILIVDDENSICEILQFNLATAGYEVETATSAEEALELDLAHYDLLLLDVMMGGMSGFVLADKIKKMPGLQSIPIIFITAADSENSQLTGFNLGADDYISKPFRLTDVIARVKAVLRRTLKHPADAREDKTDGIVTFDTLCIDNQSKRATVDGTDISLTGKEFAILQLLLCAAGKIFSREEILQRVWPDDVMVLNRSVDVAVSRLRHKLGRYAENIVSRNGFGYMFSK